MSARHLWAAFWARPFGMPLPPNLFGLATFGLLGAFLDPGFWLIGAGLEVAYLLALSRSARFQAAVDAAGSGNRASGQREARHQALWSRLPRADQEAQGALEARCDEVLETLGPEKASTHADGLARLAWMHLKLLAARQALERVMASGTAEAAGLEAQAQALTRRLSSPELSDELKRTLEQQAEVIMARRDGHLEAARRRERVQAELRSWCGAWRSRPWNCRGSGPWACARRCWRATPGSTRSGSRRWGAAGRSRSAPTACSTAVSRCSGSRLSRRAAQSLLTEIHRALPPAPWP